jgi:radical SAM protein (TIGR01212 family)
MASSLAGTPGSNPSDALCGDLVSAMHRQIQLLSEKWPAEKYDVKYLAYFQSHTNTYAPVDELRAKFEAALAAPGVVGLAIATRPDCLPDDVLDLLSELNERTFLWVELGLQTIHDETARSMNLCHTLADYDDAVRRLTARGIRVVTHLILGLPGETREMMLESVRYACKSTDQTKGTRIFGLKLHMLNVVRGSGMAQTMPDYIPFDSMEEYIASR